MALCTLPTSVSPSIFDINPQIDVVLFVNESHLVLYRKSGQQVWSSRIPPSKTSPRKLEWSKDGKYVALIFTDGSIIIYDLINGRAQHDLSSKYQLNDGEGASSVAWSSSTQGVVNSSGNKEINQLNWWSKSNRSDTALTAVGTIDGKLRLCLYGALEINDIEVGNQEVSLVAAYETEGEYIAVCGNEFVVYRIQITGEKQKYIAEQSAQGVKLMESVISNCIKLKKTLESMHDQNRQFLNPIYEGVHKGQEGANRLRESYINTKWSHAQTELLRVALTGYLNEALLEWISVQHEQGFKKWYKAVSHSWDLLRRAIQDELLDQLTGLLLITGSLGADCTELQHFLELVYQLLKEVVLGQALFEKQASFVEHVFTEEISRAICTTRIAKVDLSEIVDDLSNNELLGQISADWGSKLLDSILPTKHSLDEKTGNIRAQLKSYLEVQTRIVLDENVKSVAPNNQGGYSLILESNKLVEAVKDRLVSEVKLEGSNHRLISGETRNYAIGIEPAGRYVCLDGQKFNLEFEPAAVAAREIATNCLMACVLSEDHQHFQFLEITLA